jgi:hypothetical protein
VAVKVLHDADVGGVNFVREIAILKGCRHSNIVQFQVSTPAMVCPAGCCMGVLGFQVPACEAGMLGIVCVFLEQAWYVPYVPYLKQA